MKKLIIIVFLCVMVSSSTVLALYAACCDDDENPNYNVVFVDANHTGTEDGTKDNPFNTIMEAVDLILGCAAGDYCIWVKEGTYNENIEMEFSDWTVSVYGGYDSDWDSRDPLENPVVINGQPTPSVTEAVEITSCSYIIFDGFYVKPHLSQENGIKLDGASNVVLRNNYIYNESPPSPTPSANYNETGIYAMSNCSSISVTSNYVWATCPCGIHFDGVDGNWEITSNNVRYATAAATPSPLESAGIYVENAGSTGEIQDNYMNACDYGIFAGGSFGITVSRNEIGSPLGNTDYVGIYVDNDSGEDTCEFNRIYGFSEHGIYANGKCVLKSNAVSSCVIGIEDHHSSGTVGIINNNTCSCTNGVGYGIYRNTSTQTYIYNNICFQNTVGLKASSTTNLNYDYNCVYGNTTNYSGCEPQTHDIDSNPRFYTTFPPPDWSFFLRQNPPQTTGFYSPCKDAGNPFISPYGTTRTDYWPDAGIIDIGAHWPFARIE